MVINPKIGFYIPIIRNPIKGGMTIPNIATFDHGTYIVILCIFLSPPVVFLRFVLWPEERGNPRIVQTLVDAGADGNIRSPSVHRGGNTAMDLAREGGHKEVEKKLGEGNKCKKPAVVQSSFHNIPRMK